MDAIRPPRDGVAYSAAGASGPASSSELNRQPRVVIFAPAPLLTITIEDQAVEPDIHIHAGGQGVWQARMVRSLGTEPTICATFAGETGRVLHHLLVDEHFDLHAVERPGHGAAYIHDRRGGKRQHIAETGGDPISRHALDTLYGLTLREGLDADVVLLSGPHGDRAIPHDVYRRLAADLRTSTTKVIVDLSGARLAAALQGGVDIVKISHDELLAEGRISSTEAVEIVDAMHRIHTEGAETVIVTRAEQPLLLLTGGRVRQVTAPRMEILDASGAGDSFTAALAALLAQGRSIEDAVVVGAAAGALSVTRHGLGTGDPSAIWGLSRFVKTDDFHADRPIPRVRISLEDLAQFTHRGSRPASSSSSHEPPPPPQPPPPVVPLDESLPGTEIHTPDVSAGEVWPLSPLESLHEGQLEPPPEPPAEVHDPKVGVHEPSSEARQAPGHADEGRSDTYDPSGETQKHPPESQSDPPHEPHPPHERHRPHEPRHARQKPPRETSEPPDATQNETPEH